MAQKLLDAAHSVVQQVRGEAVSKGVWRDLGSRPASLRYLVTLRGPIGRSSAIALLMKTAISTEFVFLTLLICR